MRIQPDRVLVWNDVQRREAIELHGCPPDERRDDRRRAVRRLLRRARRPRRARSSSPSTASTRRGPMVLYLGLVAADRAQRDGADPALGRVDPRVADERDPRRCNILVRPHPALRNSWTVGGLLRPRPRWRVAERQPRRRPGALRLAAPRARGRGPQHERDARGGDRRPAGAHAGHPGLRRGADRHDALPLPGGGLRRPGHDRPRLRRAPRASWRSVLAGAAGRVAAQPRLRASSSCGRTASSARCRRSSPPRSSARPPSSQGARARRRRSGTRRCARRCWRFLRRRQVSRARGRGLDDRRHLDVAAPGARRRSRRSSRAPRRCSSGRGTTRWRTRCCTGSRSCAGCRRPTASRRSGSSSCRAAACATGTARWASAISTRGRCSRRRSSSTGCGARCRRASRTPSRR